MERTQGDEVSPALFEGTKIADNLVNTGCIEDLGYSGFRDQMQIFLIKLDAD